MREFQINLSSSPFNLEFTLVSGQVFRWFRRGNWWGRVFPQGLLMVQQEEDRLNARLYSSRFDEDEEFVKNYFRLDDDLPLILTSMSRDAVIDSAIRRFYGLRLVRQDPWECLVSYICATNTNIPSIQKMLEALSRRFGSKKHGLHEDFFSFPTSSNLAQASLTELRKCGLGYRAPFVKKVAEKVASGELKPESLSELDYDSARRILVNRDGAAKPYLGVGPKVADCVLLFSLGKLEAFPLDVWMRRCILQSYAEVLGEELAERLSVKMRRKANITVAEYASISRRIRRYFGEFAGYAQEYLYLYTRSNAATPKNQRS